MISLLLFVLLLDLPKRHAAESRVDVIEFNSHLLDNGQVCWKQVIFWSWESDLKELHVCHWAIDEGIERPTWNPQRRLYSMNFWDRRGNCLRRVVAPTIRDTRTFDDPEKLDAEVFPSSQRRGLVK